MAVDARAPRNRPWTPKVVVQLTVLAGAAFVCITAEAVPITALPAIASGLHVREAWVSTLVTSYALVAAVMTVPLVRWTSRWPRRRTLLFALTCLTVSQLVSALAPKFVVLVGGHVLGAFTHGLIWSVVAPIGVRLVPATHASRATTAVYLGSGAAMVIGNPLTAAISQLWGWRSALVAVAVVAVVIITAARFALPPMVLSDEHLETVGAHRHHHRNVRLVTVSALTLIMATGHFISYTFIVVIIRNIVDVHGPPEAWLLAAYGVAGLAAMTVLAPLGDHRPGSAVIGYVLALVVVFGLFSVLAGSNEAASVTVPVGAAVILLWGASATAVAPILQTAAIRSAPADPDGGSSLYIVAYQLGIVGGSLSGGLIYGRGGVFPMVVSSLLLSATALIISVANRGLFRLPARSM